MRQGIPALFFVVAIAGCGGDGLAQSETTFHTAAQTPPTCEDARAGDATVDPRLVSLLTRSGDLESGRQHFRLMRLDLERTLSKFDVAAPERFKPALDPLFSDAEIQRRLTCAFAHEGRGRATVDAWDAWIADADMRAIHGRIFGPPRLQGPTGAPPDAGRVALLRRVMRATGFVEMSTAAESTARASNAIIETALGNPTSGKPTLGKPTPGTPATAAPPPGEAPPQKRTPSRRGPDGQATRPPPDPRQRAAEDWFAMQLDGIDDATLQRFLAFAESGPGRAFYRARQATYGAGMRDWQARLQTAANAQIAPQAAALGAGTLDDKLAEARRLLEQEAMPAQEYPQGLYDARTLLQNAERLEPKNPDVLVLKARIEMALRPHLAMAAPHDRGQIRDRVAPGGPDMASGYEQIDRDLAKAILLAPANADAHLYLGRSKFLQRNDTVAAHMLREARRMKADPATLALFEGDLAYVGGDAAKAERLYRESLAAAEAAPSVRDLAARHLGNALRAQGRGNAYPAIAAQTLQTFPDLWSLRFDYADALLDGAGTAADAQAAIASVPETWQPPRHKLAMTRVQVQRAIEATPAARAGEAKRVHEIARDTQVIGQALCGARDVAIIETVIRANPGSEAYIADALLGCAVSERRSDAVAVALRYARDIDQPLSGLWGDTALCGAAARNDVRTLTLLLQKKADTALPCGGTMTPRERLAAQAAKGDAEARRALAAFDAAVGG
jgi:hypothetical protein